MFVIAYNNIIFRNSTNLFRVSVKKKKGNFQYLYIQCNCKEHTMYDDGAEGLFLEDASENYIVYLLYTTECCIRNINSL